MIYTTNLLKNKYSNYVDPVGKIKRLTDAGEIITLKRGLYIDKATDYNLYSIANMIYGPSYVSFNTALSFHGLIPEATYVVTSATTNKLKKKEFTNRIGTFTYRDVPVSVYSYGIHIVGEEENKFLIATKEKALCDKLYELPPLKKVGDLEDMIFDDMRIDRDEFNKLNFDDLIFISKKYHSTNLRLLCEYVARR